MRSRTLPWREISFFSSSLAVLLSLINRVSKSLRGSVNSLLMMPVLVREFPCDPPMEMWSDGNLV